MGLAPSPVLTGSLKKGRTTGKVASVEIITFGAIWIRDWCLHPIDYTHVVILVRPAFDLGNEGWTRHDGSRAVVAKLLVSP